MNPLANLILDLVFPRFCLGCQESMTGSSESYLCRDCLASIPFSKNFACAFCASPVVLGQTCPFCVKEHHLDRLWVATSYEKPLVEKILKTMKYRFVKSLAGDAAGLMVNYLQKKILPNLPIDPQGMLAVPTPLHRRRLNWRGFNQSEIIGQKVSERLGWPFDPTILKRQRSAKPQADIKDKVSRIENVRNTFVCQKPEAIRGKTVILIDDVSTTGSTLDDGARALKGAGAHSVIGFVFARNRFDLKKPVK